jgi:hypothetical protein
MNWGGPGFVIAIIALCYGGWLINNWIRAKHGYDLEDEWGGKSPRSEGREATELKHTIEGLEARLARMEERTRVLEEVITDRGYNVAAEIEALRDRRAGTDERKAG